MLKRQWPAILLAFVLPVMAVFWWWGGFSKVEITEGEAGPYHFAYLDHEGDIADARKTQRKVFDALKLAGIEPGDNVVVLLTDPRTTPKSAQRVTQRTIKIRLATNSAAPMMPATITCSGVTLAASAS